MDIYDLALTMTRNLGPKTAIHLIDCFGSAQSVFEATEEQLISQARLNLSIAESIIKRAAFAQAEKEIRFAAKNETKIIAATDPEYPALLRECNDYPHVLYVRGSVEALSKRSVSIVGTRKATEYGRKVCERLVEELSQISNEIAIVSGLASGIDGFAHRAAIANGITTIAVLPTPLNIITPSEHILLSKEILNRGGCLVTEYHSDAVTKNYGFTARNRIIAGLSEGTLIVESPFNGGSLITAGIADGYGRSVMAVPGRIFDQASKGTNHIIKTMQAKPICSSRDIVNELGWDDFKNDKPKSDLKEVLSEESIRVLDSIKEGETISIDRLAEVTKLNNYELAIIILELEVDGYIKRLPGNTYERE